MFWPGGRGVMLSPFHVPKAPTAEIVPISATVGHVAWAERCSPPDGGSICNHHYTHNNGSTLLL